MKLRLLFLTRKKSPKWKRNFRIALSSAKNISRRMKIKHLPIKRAPRIKGILGFCDLFKIAIMPCALRNPWVSRAVIAHELGHQKRKHPIKNLFVFIFLSIACHTLPKLLGISTFFCPILVSLILFTMFKYSTLIQQESEADSLAIKYGAKYAMQRFSQIYGATPTQAVVKNRKLFKIKIRALFDSFLKEEKNEKY